MQVNRCLLKALITLSLVVLLSTLLAACGGGDRQQDGGQGAPETLDGKALVEERCTECHGLDRTTGASKTKEEWKTTVERMVSKGTNLNAEEQAAVIEYLAATYSD
jgi:mono/diheme cytochrome c family protein